jgi:hypothetical protein
MKGFAIFAVVLAVCAVFAIAAGTFLVRAVKEPVAAELERLGQDVAQYAASHEQTDCAPEAFDRLSTCDGAFWCSIQAPVFAKECLRRARHSADLCEGVPKSLVQGVLWPSQQCLDVDVDPEMCTRILNEVVRTCQKRS